ncbi:MULTISPECIES: hypothetical protein [unclassified Ensifer]|uniref:hypothetical protein n=1 Tax=unclassified Ensifer TaxID=2633371 RepID=UPI000813BE37|nr:MULTISPECIES: hypothetical protein [unclassified Ensifer]OCO99782.1 hypothetical protein BC362_25090 [Ensifer sp. LC14]OCP06136.1 hypothetical protein BBX50_24005 [Ensifer sp. LC11]OCP07085.1 hypothetical protein BC374_24225 [Ensifer sp. LC13]OCP31461.1 hypothetical protein BC364_23430 [Ensifer sp. LC499]
MSIGPKATKADSPSPTTTKQRVSEKLRILSVEEIGSPFGDYRIKLRLDNAQGDIQERVLHVLSENGPADGNPAYQDLLRLNTDVARLVGSRVHLDTSGDIVQRILAAKAGRREVIIAYGTIPEPVSGKRKVVLELQAARGDGVNDPEGFLEIVLESRDAAEQQTGQKQFQDLVQAIGVENVEDVDQLLFIPFTITDGGDFLPAPANDNLEQKAA